MFEDIPFISDVWDTIPDTLLGLPKGAFIGLLIGILIACYEGIFTKYKDYALKVSDKDIKFSKKYLMSGVVAILVTFLTVDAVMESGILTGVTSFATAFAIGLAEGGQTIKFLNKRIDVYIKKSAVKMGATEEQAEKVSDAVEFIEINEPNEPKKPTQISFEEL